MESRKQYLIDRISDLLRARGFNVSLAKQSGGSAGADLVCRSGSSNLLVECKVMNFYRASEFRAAVGDAILRFHHEPSAQRPLGSRFMVAFLLRRMSRKAEENLQEYSLKYLPDLQWAIIAEDGSGIVHIGDHEERISCSPFHGVLHGESIGSRASLFSPNNQWLLKILILSGIDSRYWGGPSRIPKGISELAKMSGVSQPSVSAFVIKAEQEGFLVRGHQGFLIQNHQELLDDWSYALKNRARRPIGFRFLYPDESEEKFLRNLRSYCQDQEVMPLVVGGHLGCHLLGLGRSNVRNARLYVSKAVEKVLSALDLVEEKSDSSHLSLIVRHARDSVFRCAVKVDGVPVSEILQWYFDVRFSYARGREPTDYIYERILQPHFVRAE